MLDPERQPPSQPKRFQTTTYQHRIKYLETYIENMLEEINSVYNARTSMKRVIDW